jgi:acetyl-CoA C-acetyltransferase
MLDAAASLAKSAEITTAAQHEFAINSHRKALQFMTGDLREIVPIAGQIKDGAARVLKAALCDRLPMLAGDKGFALTSANTALKADGAAAVLVVSEDIALKVASAGNFVAKVMGHKSAGSDPENPALAPIAAITGLLEELSLNADDIDVVEMMEAFAVQAMLCLKGCDLQDHPFNVGGGALARGHPIGASGAVNVVRLFHELKKLPAGSNGLAAIAAAGGLGSALLLKRG